MDHSTLTREFQAADRRHRRDVRHVDIRGGARALARTGRRLAVLAAALILFYFLVCVPLAWYQTTLIYWNRSGSVQTVLPEVWKMREYVSQDRSVEFASYVRAGEPGRPTVVYLHGRGENFRIASWNTKHYQDMGWTVVIPEYPGFNGLKGETGERVIQVEMSIVHQDLMERGVKPRQLLIHGNSLGAGPAMMLAQYPNGMLLLTAPVASMSEIVTEYLPYYPTILLRDKWDNAARARTRYPSHAEVVHATDDWVVPVTQGRRLAKAAAAHYREIPTGGHAIAGEARMIGFDGKGRFTIWNRPILRVGS
jgi:acetyl esterase/lipase